MRKTSAKIRISAFALSSVLLLSACGKIDLTMSEAESSAPVTTAPVTTNPPETTAPPVEEPAIDDNFVKCKAAICYDITNEKIIYEKNADDKIYPASLTKLLTALTAINYTSSDYIYYVGSEIELVEPDSSMAWLYEGTYIDREGILTAMLAPSGNDAAYVIAVNVARKVYGENLSDTEAAEYFGVLMTDYAKYIGAENSNFVVPDGYHNDDHYTTARDMLKIAIASAGSETICNITKEPEPLVYDEHGNWLSWTNGNKLLEDDTIPYNVYGLKTGFTDEAGFCFIGLAEMGGTKILTLTFDNYVPNRYADTKKLFDLGFDIYDSDYDYYYVPEEPEEEE